MQHNRGFSVSFGPGRKRANMKTLTAPYLADYLYTDVDLGIELECEVRFSVGRGYPGSFVNPPEPPEIQVKSFRVLDGKSIPEGRNLINDDFDRVVWQELLSDRYDKGVISEEVES